MRFCAVAMESSSLRDALARYEVTRHGKRNGRHSGVVSFDKATERA
jgi:hypothetical protein